MSRECNDRCQCSVCKELDIVELEAENTRLKWEAERLREENRKLRDAWPESKTIKEWSSVENSIYVTTIGNFFSYPDCRLYGTWDEAVNAAAEITPSKEEAGISSVADKLREELVAAHKEIGLVRQSAGQLILYVALARLDMNDMREDISNMYNENKELAARCERLETENKILRDAFECVG
jgi:cell division protein FtsB